MANEPAPSTPDSRPAAELGLAALLLGAIVFILFPLTAMLIFACMVLAERNPYLQSRHIDFGVIGIFVFVGALLWLALHALISGVRAVGIAMQRRQPLGLAIAGALTGFLAVAASLVLLGTTLYSVEWIRELQKRIELRKVQPDRLELVPQPGQNP